MEKALNVHTLIKFQRTVASMLRLEYGKAARQLLQLQRRQTVLETRKLHKHEKSSSEDDSDSHQHNRLVSLQRQMQMFDEKETLLAKGVFMRNGANCASLNQTGTRNINYARASTVTKEQNQVGNFTE